MRYPLKNVVIILAIVVSFIGACSKLGLDDDDDDAEKPAAPSGLAVQAATGITLTLSWQASSGAASYTLYRSASENGTYAAVKTGLTALTHRDRELAQTTAYWYKVSATNSAGEGAQSAAVKGTTVSIMVSTLAGSGSPGSADGTGSAASFKGPTGTAVDSSGTIYVADGDNYIIRKIHTGRSRLYFRGDSRRIGQRRRDGLVSVILFSLQHRRGFLEEPLCDGLS